MAATEKFFSDTLSLSQRLRAEQGLSVEEADKRAEYVLFGKLTAIAGDDNERLKELVESYESATLQKLFEAWSAIDADIMHQSYPEKPRFEAT